MKYALALLALAAGIFGCSKSSNQLPIVAITQIVSHASLDKVHQGIVDEMQENGFVDKKSVSILFQNPQGNMATNAQIAKQFVQQAPKVLVGISTPSAQTLISASAKTEIPVIFATVTDPVGAQLVGNLAHPGGRVTGTRNSPPMDKELLLIRAIVPRAKTVGILANLGESNSVTIINNAKQAATGLGINIEVASIQSSAEVAAAAQSLAHRVDAVILLQDNTVASALPSVIKAMKAAKVPVFTTFVEGIEAGALAGLAYDEYDIGRQTGKIVVSILRGEKAGSISVQDPTKIELLLNEALTKELQLNIDVASLKKTLALS